jgi:hypothetical protein
MLMIENYRTGRVWNRFMQNPDVQRGLAVANFLPLTGVVSRTGLPLSFALRQNYPNPFNPTTNINFSLSGSGWVTLKVYDLLGRVTATLVEGTLPAGNHEVQFDGRRLSSGVYVYRLIAGGSAQSRTMMLLK